MSQPIVLAFSWIHVETFKITRFWFIFRIPARCWWVCKFSPQRLLVLHNNLMSITQNILHFIIVDVLEDDRTDYIDVWCHYWFPLPLQQGFINFMSFIFIYITPRICLSLYSLYKVALQTIKSVTVLLLSVVAGVTTLLFTKTYYSWI